MAKLWGGLLFWGFFFVWVCFGFFHSRVEILCLQHTLQDTSLQQAILVSLLRLREFGDRWAPLSKETLIWNSGVCLPKYLKPSSTVQTDCLHGSGFLKWIGKHLKLPLGSFPCHVVCLIQGTLAKHLVFHCHHGHTFFTKSPLSHLRAFNKRGRFNTAPKH